MELAVEYHGRAILHAATALVPIHDGSLKSSFVETRKSKISRRLWNELRDTALHMQAPTAAEAQGQ